MMADQARREAEVVLLAVMTGHSEIQADLLAHASTLGPEYLSAVTVSACLTARGWARQLARNNSVNFGDYLHDAEGDAEEWDREAHSMAKRLLNVASVGDARPLGREIEAYVRKSEADMVGMYVTHLIALGGDLVRTVMEIKRDQTREEMKRADPEG